MRFNLRLLPFSILVAALVEIPARSAHGDEEPVKETRLEALATLPLEELANVRVTTVATGTPKTVAETPSVTTVITAQDIETLGARTLEQVLDTIPGMHVFPGHTYSSKYVIRGITSRFNPETLTMINGVPMYDLLRASNLLSAGSIPVSMISRVEIIRGPGSAVYGADAFAGVVNVVTKTQSEIQGNRVGLLAGNFDTLETWLQHGNRYGNLDLVLMADFLTTEGHGREITEDAQTQLDRTYGTQASLAPGSVNLSRNSLVLFMDLALERWRLRGGFLGLSNLGTGQGVAEALDPAGKLSQPRYLVELTYSAPKPEKHLSFTSLLSYTQTSLGSDENLHLFPPGSDLGNGAIPDGFTTSLVSSERQIVFNNDAIYTGLPHQRIRLGIGAYYGQIYHIHESKNYGADLAPLPGLIDFSHTAAAFSQPVHRSNLNGVIQDEWRISEDWEFTAGARYDYYSDFGGTFNPRLALVWKTTPQVRGKLIYGRAFRAPTMTELYESNNPVNLGNKDLRPETIQVLELAWDYEIPRKLEAAINLYHYLASDLIEFVPDATGISATAQNTGRQSGNGIEAKLKWRIIAPISFTANYTFQRSIDQSLDAPVGGYPNQRAYARADWFASEFWSFGAQFLWIGQRDREPGDPRAPLKGYTTVDLNLRRKSVFKNFNLMVTVRNLFNADVREPSNAPAIPGGQPAIPNDLPQAGRNYYAEVTYHF